MGVGEDGFDDFSRLIVDRFKTHFGKQSQWSEKSKWNFYALPQNIVADKDNVKKLSRLVSETALFLEGRIEH
jgi:hypothetical protein